MTQPMIYLLLFVAIVAEVAGTTALARTESFTRLAPSVVTVIGYAVAIYLLSVLLRFMPTGIVYALWSGLGIVFITAVAWIWYGQKLDLAAVVGLALILAGVVVLNLFSKSVPH